MTISFKEFTLKKWEVDKDIFQYKGKQEQLNIVPFLGASEALAFTDDPSFPVVLLNIRWIYDFKKDGQTPILEYIAEDEMIVVSDDKQNIQQEVSRAIRESYSRYAMKFDELKSKIKLRNGLPLVQQEFVNVLAQKVISRLQERR